MFMCLHMYYMDDACMWMHICMYIQVHGVFDLACANVYVCVHVYVCICMYGYVCLYICKLVNVSVSLIYQL